MSVNLLVGLLPNAALTSRPGTVGIGSQIACVLTTYLVVPYPRYRPNHSTQGSSVQLLASLRLRTAPIARPSHDPGVGKEVPMVSEKQQRIPTCIDF